MVKMLVYMYCMYDTHSNVAVQRAGNCCPGIAGLSGPIIYFSCPSCPPRSPLESHPCLYAYQLSSVQDEQLQAASSQFTVTSDEYNWNFLDHHVCGYSDFEELGEV